MLRVRWISWSPYWSQRISKGGFSSAAWRRGGYPETFKDFLRFLSGLSRPRKVAPAARHQKLCQRQFGGRGLRAVDRRLRRHIRYRASVASADRGRSTCFARKRCRQTASGYDEPRPMAAGRGLLRFHITHPELFVVLPLRKRQLQSRLHALLNFLWLLELRTQHRGLFQHLAHSGNKMISAGGFVEAAPDVPD